MAGLSTLAAASGAVQGLQQGTQNAEDTKRFLASLLQQQKQFDVTSGFESRRVGALEQKTGAEVKQMGADTDIKKATLQDMNLTHKTKVLLFNAFVDADIAPKQAEQMATKAAADTLTNKRNIMTTQSAMDYLEQDPELARDIGLAGPRQEVAAARGAEAGATGQEITTGALTTDIQLRQDAARQNLDLARQLAPLQVQAAETKNVQLLKSIEVLEAQLKSIPLADQLTQGKIIAQDIENRYAEIEHNSRMALAEATIAKIEADTGLTLENRDAVKVRLAQNDRRLDNDMKRIRRQYSDIGNIQNALSDSRKKGIDAEIFRLNADLITASHAKDEGGIKAIKQQLNVVYAQLGLVPVFNVERDDRWGWFTGSVPIHYVSALKALTGEQIYPYSPRANGGDTGGTTGGDSESQVRILFEQGKQSEALDFGRKNGLDDSTINRIRNEVK